MEGYLKASELGISMFLCSEILLLQSKSISSEYHCEDFDHKGDCGTIYICVRRSFVLVLGNAPLRKSRRGALITSVYIYLCMFSVVPHD